MLLQYPWRVLVTLQGLLDSLLISLDTQEQVRSLFFLFMGHFLMVARQMGSNRNSISHKESNNSAVKTYDDGNINFKECCDKTE